MRALVTGATGFIGGRVAAKLRARGDDVVALVRNPQRATELRSLGCELVEGDLRDLDAIKKGVAGCGSVFHAAAVYKVGVPESRHGEIYDTNVAATERVLDAAADAGASRIIHVSTINVFGNTRGKIVDESYTRDLADGFLSYYDETKYLAHQIALDRIAGGAPVIIVQPGGVYGPGDHSEIANMIDQFTSGRLKVLMFPELGLNLLHIDDAAEGILLAHDRGRIGESYVLGGEVVTVRDLFSVVAELSGRKVPRFTVPVALIRLAIPFGGLVARALRTEPNLREAIRAAEGVTYWGSDAKARRELGYNPRDLRTGMAQTLSPA